MKKLTLVAVCTLALSAAFNAACTVSINGVPLGSDAGSDAATNASDTGTSIADAALADAGNSFATCAECGAARCASESTTCNTVKAGEQGSPCKGYSECISVCTGTEAEKATCRDGCNQAYPEADAFYTCLNSKCALSCILN